MYTSHHKLEIQSVITYKSSVGRCDQTLYFYIQTLPYIIIFFLGQVMITLEFDQGGVKSRESNATVVLWVHGGDRYLDSGT